MQATSATRTRRIILANQPRLFREMLRRTIENIPSLEVVGEVADLTRLPALVEETGAQWLIVSLTRAGEMPPALEALLAQHPSLCILGVVDDGSQAEIEWVEFHRERLQGLSLDELLGALCTQSSWKLTPPYFASHDYQQDGSLRN